MLMIGAAAVLALTALVASSATHRAASGATVPDQRPGTAAQVGVDAWFDDPGAIGAVAHQGVDAWFNDSLATTSRAPGFDAWFEDSTRAAAPAGFDAWFNDR